MSPALPLHLHAAATLAMAGVIWFVQVVHYPLFPFAAGGGFARFAAQHQQRTTAVVAPLMLLELITAIWLLVPASGAPPRLAWTGLALLALIWLSTALLQVPLHRRLSRGFDEAAARRLVATNWLRTLAWTARGALALWVYHPLGTGMATT